MELVMDEIPNGTDVIPRIGRRIRFFGLTETLIRYC